MSEPFENASAGAEPPRVIAALNELRREDELEHDAELDGVHVRDTDWTSAEADDLTITASRLERVRLTATVLERLRITDCVFVDCDMTGAQWHEAAMRRVEFVDCRMSGVVLTAAKLRDVVFRTCRLDQSNMRTAQFHHVEFVDCDLRDGDLYGADATKGLRILDSDLTGAELSKAKLTGSRLHGSTLERLKGATALAGAVIGSAQSYAAGAQVMAALGIVVDDDAR